MNKNAFVFLLTITLFQLVKAQNPGCEGDRYQTIIFDSVTITSDIVYGTNVTIGGDEMALKMDVYEPFQDTLSRRPIIFIIHGGGFTSGSKSGYRFVKMATDFAKKGYVAISIDYRLYDLKVPPDSFLLKDAIVRGMSDLKAAMRYMHEDMMTVNTYKADTNYYFLSGVSSGAIIANTTAYLDDINEVDNQMRQLIYNHGGLQGNSSNNLQYRPRAGGVLNASGGMLQYDYIDEDDPSLVSIHCVGDAVMPFKRDWISIMGDTVCKMHGSFFLHGQANLQGVESELIQIPGVMHVQYFIDPLYYDSMINVACGMFREIACSGSGGGIPVAIKEVWDQKNLNIYPNPADQYLTIDISEPCDIEIYNTLGIMEKRFRLSGNRISLSELRPGLYFLILKKEHQTRKLKFIIAR